MKLSIITVCQNSEDTIQDTLESVQNQTYKNVEYIVIDGGSTDRTLDVVREYSHIVTTLISEPDEGVFDAMNKGIMHASGDVVGILNSDDFYWKNDVLEQVVESFDNPRVDACYGNLVYVSRKNKKRTHRYWRAGYFDDQKIKLGWSPPHPTFFVRKKFYDEYGLFNTDVQIAADYELMLRFIKKANLRMHYIDKDLVGMRIRGRSGKNIFMRMRGWSDLRKAWLVNGMKPSRFFLVTRIFSKVNQFYSVR